MVEVTRKQGEGECGVIVYGCRCVRGSVWDDGKVLEIDSGDDCRTM